MSSKQENEKLNENEKLKGENENENENEYEYEYENEIISQDKTIKNLNDLLDKKIDKSKSFKDQIKLLKEWEDLKGY